MDCLLTIDQGNSTAKTVVFRADKPVDVRRFDSLRLEDLEGIVAHWQPEAIVYCAVGHVDARLVESLRCFPDAEVMVVTHATPLPVPVRYATPSTLGLDRVCAAIGAATLFPGEAALVVDAGTAVTLDVVGSDGAFMGGNIAPGLRMRLKALHDFTKALPEVKPDGPLPPFGTDTDTAIRAGVAGGLLAEIRHCAAEAKRLYGARRIVITGGDAPLIAEYLKNDNLAIDVAETLTAEGLKRIFLYNEDTD